MSEYPAKLFTAFDGDRLLSTGSLIEVAFAAKAATDRGAGSLLTFDDCTGAVIDLDLRGSPAEIKARLSAQIAQAPPGSRSGRHVSSRSDAPTNASRGPGRPKLGVVAREVTLLPRHWEWLASQPSGASAMLRRLVDEARRLDGSQSHARARREAAYRFISAVAGDLAGFEEVARALFAGKIDSFERQMAPWPADLRNYALRLASLGASMSGPCGEAR